MIRIEIVGNIASGKTTLVKILHLNNFKKLFEDFNKINFLKPFYKNPKIFAFETELQFLLQHYHQIKKNKSNNSICDFSFYLDSFYALTTLTQNEMLCFTNIHNEILTQLKKPDLIIHLVCPINILFERIQNRGRNFEKKINIDFLNRIESSINKFIDKKLNILNINSHKYNYLYSSNDMLYINKEIDEAIKKL